MDAINSNGKKANSSSHLILDNFYKEAIRITRFTKNQVKDILIGSFGETFERSRIPEYLELLRTYAEERNSKEALDNMRDRIRNRFPEIMPPNPCPIEGCDGVMQWDRNWNWLCSKGGLRHRLANNISNHTGIPAARIVERIEQISAERKVVQEAELTKWREGINEPFEPQGWHILKEEEIIEETSGAFTYTDATEIPE